MSAPTDAVMDPAVHACAHLDPQPGCDWCLEVETARPTDHLAAALAAVEEARGAILDHAALHLARAQIHATIALAEETRTANLLAALDYSVGQHLDPIDRRDEITARLWPSS